MNYSDCLLTNTNIQAEDCSNSGQFREFVSVASSEREARNSPVSPFSRTIKRPAEQICGVIDLTKSDQFMDSSDVVMNREYQLPVMQYSMKDIDEPFQQSLIQPPHAHPLSKEFEPGPGFYISNQMGCQHYHPLDNGRVLDFSQRAANRELRATTSVTEEQLLLVSATTRSTFISPSHLHNEVDTNFLLPDMTKSQMMCSVTGGSAGCCGLGRCLCGYNCSTCSSYSFDEIAPCQVYPSHPDMQETLSPHVSVQDLSLARREVDSQESNEATDRWSSTSSVSSSPLEPLVVPSPSSVQSFRGELSSWYNGTMLNVASQKPALSYLALISLAIMGSPIGMALLSEIYTFVKNTFPYYNNDKKAWRNSIRHNLSLHSCFIKVGRSPQGKGHYWRIKEHCLDSFRRGDFRLAGSKRKNAKESPPETMARTEFVKMSCNIGKNPLEICKPSPSPRYTNSCRKRNYSTFNEV